MSMILNWMLLSILFIMGAMAFVFNRKHLLSMLLSLEYIVLSLFLMLFMCLNMFNYENFFCTMFLVFSVCEGSLGLSILVAMNRTHGNDYFQSFNIL